MSAKRKLIIVESPAKVKTIKRFLGAGSDVEASGGHVRDLPKSRMGVDVDRDYEPSYITIRGKGDVITALKQKAKKADVIYLATDPDREGEAIAWHLKELLKKEEGKIRRISFNEITKQAVTQALKAPRDIDTDLVDAQQARRVLDRVAGYSVSPLLWKKVKRGLSAGRVQSSTLNLVCAREAEIDAFVPQEYWTVTVSLQPEGSSGRITLEYQPKTRPLACEEDVKALLQGLVGETFTVSELETLPRRKKAPLPFTTSTLQQEASHALNFSPRRTMSIAQQLYEGVELKGEGTTGLITYLRTDSTRISEEAAAAASAYIEETYGRPYRGTQNTDGRNSGHAQDAHEAIRPTLVTRTPASVRDQLSQDQYRLYNLIWKRFLASRMEDYCYDSTVLVLAAGEAAFRAAAHVTTFDGYRLVYNPENEKTEKDRSLSRITRETVFSDPQFESAQHFTQPPAHYTEASLVHAMEACGIGRPSTYAPTLTTLMARRYLGREGRNLFVTELGEAVNDLTLRSVPMLADKDFTARMEDELDKVAEGQLEWKAVLREFYPPFREKLDAAMRDLDKVKVADEESDVICENCGRRMVYKYGPHGRFLACPGFPECRNTKPLVEKAGWNCPVCGAEMVVRKTKAGRRFYACPDEKCGHMSWQKENFSK
ncbi:MAG: type I DNA topoisomerase [Lachnospiraceae bacterium]|nr:type I DNA topoisomerase [Lachnospiraceae bacterium]